MRHIKWRELVNKLKAMFCALFRHSLIVENYWGYKYCGRCGAYVGDSLVGPWGGENAVVIGHNCDVCRKNYKKMGFVDKFMVPNPSKGAPYHRSLLGTLLRG